MEFFLTVLLSLLPVCFWLFLWWYQDKEREPFKVLFMSFLLGIVVAVLLIYGQESIELWLDGYSDELVTVLLAILEEIGKAIALVIAIEWSHRWFTQIVDGLVYGASVALGFAFAEMAYLLFSFPVYDLTTVLVFSVRSLNTLVAHSFFTGFFGFFYASAYLRKDIFPEKKKEKPWHHFLKNLGEALPFHVTLFHLLPNRPSKHGHYPGSLILEGILMASLLHALFNLFLRYEWNGYQLGFLTFPLIFALGYVLWRVFLGKVYTKVVRRVKG